jgi:hypothetical protein
MSKRDDSKKWVRWVRPDAPRYFRRFHQYLFEQVLDVARMLYGSTIKSFDWTDSKDWFCLVQLAFVWLDHVHDNYETVVALSRAKDATWRKIESRDQKRNAELKGLPSKVPYQKAVTKIMNNRHFGLADARFIELVHHAWPFVERYFSLVNTTPGKLLNRWRKNEWIPLEYVHQLHLAHECHVEFEKQQAREKQAKRRGPRFDVKDKPTVLEVARDKQARGVSVEHERARRLFRNH